MRAGEMGAGIGGSVTRPLRVMVAHGAYQQRGGEDSVVEDEIALLRKYGHEVELYTRHNDEVVHVSRVALAAQTIWSEPSARQLRERIAAFRPDVLHVHNTFPLLSPSIYWAARRAGVPVVQTLHNFRLLCPQAMFLREGRICESCLGHLPWAGVRHGCFRDSVPMTAVMGTMIGVHRALGTWQRHVDRYIALNEFCRRKFVEGGLPAERMVVKPNFVDAPTAPSGPRSGLLFVGRLSKEKGVDAMVQAANGLDAGVLRVAGHGPLSSSLEGVASIQALGSLDAAGVRDEMGRAVALLVPSIWYENFPRTLVEAYASGLPVIASRIGALADLVEDGVTGLLVEPGDAQSLGAAMRWALAHPDRMAQMGTQARRLYEREYTAGRNHGLLVAIYRDAIQSRVADSLA